jgi:undecaprenyl-diphosphatase
MEFLYFLEKLRMPGLNEFMLAVTQLGEETAFLMLAMIFFWCVDKKRGYLLLTVGFLGTMANQFMKLWFRVPRPWVLDPNFTILEAARDAAAGYSFPSGHTTSAVAVFGSIAVTAKNKKIAWTCVLLAVLVGLSRMYIGVHTPADVLVGALTSIVLILALKSVVMNGKHLLTVLIVMMLLALGLLAFVLFGAFPEDMYAHNLQSGLKNAYTMVGSVAGVGAVYLLEKKYVNFSTEAVWWVQILKVILGFGLVLAVKEGLRSPLEALFGDPYSARLVRYFLIVIAAGLLWPMSFRFLGRLGRHKEKTK